MTVTVLGTTTLNHKTEHWRNSRPDNGNQPDSFAGLQPERERKLPQNFWVRSNKRTCSSVRSHGSSERNVFFRKFWKSFSPSSKLRSTQIENFFLEPSGTLNRFQIAIKPGNFGIKKFTASLLWSFENSSFPRRPSIRPATRHAGWQRAKDTAQDAWSLTTSDVTAWVMNFTL